MEKKVSILNNRSVIKISGKDSLLFLNNINTLLKKNGILLMEVPNEDDELIKLVPEYSKLIHFEDHVNYFTKNTINNLFDKCNLNKKN